MSVRFRRRTLHRAVAEPRGQRLRPEGGEVVVEVTALGGEDGGGDTLGERPGFERGRGASARGVAVGGDEEADDAGGWDEGGKAAGRERGGGRQCGDSGDQSGEAAPARLVLVRERGMEA